jgi:tetratricopeptide (TPR) repeat protein
MAHDVFISYSAKDKATADAVCATLEGRGIRCWIAPRDILPGIDWGEAIIEAINASRVMVLVFSSNANDSNQIKREVERAVSKGLPIIPLRIENVAPVRSLEYFIGPVHWLDALTPPLETHLQSLGETVRLLLTRLNKGKDGDVGAGPLPGAVTTGTPERPAEARVDPALAEQPRITTKFERTPLEPKPTKWRMVAVVAVIMCAVGIGAGVYFSWPLLPPAVEKAVTPAEKGATLAEKEPSPAEQQTRPSEGYARSAQDLFNQGTAYLNQGEYDRAIANYAEAIRLDPKYAMAYMKRAETYRLKSDFDRAVADSTEAIRLEPTLALAHYHQGETNRLKGEYDKAIADATEAIRLDPKYAQAYAIRGVASDAGGGTAQVVRFKLLGVPERYALTDEVSSPLDPVDSGPVYHVVTPRASNARPMGKAASLIKLFPHGFERDAVAEASYNRIYSRMNTFNWDALRLESTLTQQRETSKTSVMPAAAIEHFPRPLKFTLDRYAMADTLALYFQAKTLLTLRALLTLSLLAAVFFQLYSHLEAKPWGLALLYMGALGAAYAWYLWAKRQDYENKYLDYRALAEGLRVQLFWRLVGLQYAVADHYLRKQRGELDCRNALRVWSLSEMTIHSPPTPQPALKCADSLQLILKHWLEDQYTFFSKVALRDQTKFQRIKKISYAFFLVGMAISVVKAWSKCSSPQTTPFSWPSEWR